MSWSCPAGERRRGLSLLVRLRPGGARLDLKARGGEGAVARRAARVLLDYVGLCGGACHPSSSEYVISHCLILCGCIIYHCRIVVWRVVPPDSVRLPPPCPCPALLPAHHLRARLPACRPVCSCEAELVSGSLTGKQYLRAHHPFALLARRASGPLCERTLLRCALRMLLASAGRRRYGRDTAEVQPRYTRVNRPR